MGARKRTLTEADRRAAIRVQALWADYRNKNPGVSQEKAAELAGFTQSAFSQFLVGRVPIRVSPALKFAKLFGVSATAIREDLGELAYIDRRPARETPKASEPFVDKPSAEALEIARAFDQLSEVCQEHVRRQIDLLRGTEANNSGRRKAVQHDVEIKRGALRQGTGKKARKGVR